MATAVAPVGLRERKKRRTQDAIVDAAMHLFSTKDYNAVSVEEIAAAADVSPRTFYRYFPAKEDVLLGHSEVDDAIREVLARRRADESDVDFIARAMLGAIHVLNTEHISLVYELIQTVPALQARLFQQIWRGGQEEFIDALLVGRRRTADNELRARVITHAVGDAIRLGAVSWLQAGQRGSLARECNKALAHLRQAFGPAGE
ncbi:MAG TPA: TetR family transcriptional regulator [Sporichthyaceae bacterium]